MPEIILRDAQVNYLEVRNAQARPVGWFGLEVRFAPARPADQYNFSVQSRGMADLGPQASGTLDLSS